MKKYKHTNTNQKNVGIIIIVSIIVLLIIMDATSNNRNYSPMLAKQPTTVEPGTDLLETNSSTSSISDFLIEKTKELIPNSLGTTTLQESIVKKKIEPKELKGQEALDFIKTLPIETQIEILKGNKK